MKAKFPLLITALILIAYVSGEAKPRKKTDEPTVELPTFVVNGTHIPSAWLEVAWECKGPMPIDRIKRAWISKVASGSPAEKAGFKAGDTLLAIGDMKVDAMNGYSLEQNLKRERQPGARENFTVQTPGQKERIVVIVFEGN
ncbi:MAG TPA: PDZ domain-containing protein [Lacunisphaera sp.]|jgi:S1-C subfamily serine protease